mmetsp:Transcript_23151/g.55044  ORF Transcript_23151/g.55044 Transcript_23151/m.55044 type:complete len:352 (+) Transcript_23151:448-1503(+)
MDPMLMATVPSWPPGNTSGSRAVTVSGSPSSLPLAAHSRSQLKSRVSWRIRASSVPPALTQYTHRRTWKVTQEAGSAVNPSVSVAVKQTVSLRPSSPRLAAYTSRLRTSRPIEIDSRLTRPGTSPTNWIMSAYGESTRCPVLLRPTDESRATRMKVLSQGTKADRTSAGTGASFWPSSDSAVQVMAGMTTRTSTQCSSPYQPKAVIFGAAHSASGVESREMAHTLCKRVRSTEGSGVQVSLRRATEHGEKMPEVFHGTNKTCGSHSEGPTIIPLGTPGSLRMTMWVSASVLGSCARSVISFVCPAHASTISVRSSTVPSIALNGDPSYLCSVVMNTGGPEKVTWWHLTPER